MTTTPTSRSGRGVAKTPLWATFAFTLLNSVGTFVVTSGIFFLTRHGYRFSEFENYALGVMLGATYIVGAKMAGPMLRRLKRHIPGLTSRGFLTALMVIMCLLCTIPWLAAQLSDPTPEGDRPPAWPIWLLVFAYSPLTGVLWPMVESYVSGGRRGHELRSVIGWWNVVWSSALIISSLGVSKLVEHHAALAILLLGMVHVVAAVLVRSFGPEPGAHEHDDPHEVPPIYHKLLITFRLLLPMSYLVSSALLPGLPRVMERAGIAVDWAVAVAAVWLLARSISFYAYQRWGGWHGRWWPAIFGPGVLLTGFGIAVLTTRVATGSIVVPLVVLGLALFGVGMATIYSGALYYAMEVGQAEIDAGGTHEALIGVGYTAGPLCGLLAQLAVQKKLIEADGFEPAMLITVGSVCAVVVGLVLRRVLKHAAT